MELPALKPCPCCGGKAEAWTYQDRGFVRAACRCLACGLRIWGSTEADAIAAWNTRATPAPPEQEGLAAYCSCKNSVTATPCIVCGKPKLVSEEWFAKQVALEDGEIGAGLGHASVPDAGLVARWTALAELYERDGGDTEAALFRETSSEYTRMAAEVERLTKERDEARAGRKLMSSQGSDTGLMFMGAQAERDAAESSLAEALKALEPFAKEAKYFDEIPGVVRTDDNFEIWQSGNYRCPINAGHLREARRLTLGRDGEGK